jgi:hypothetical protein
MRVLLEAVGDDTTEEALMSKSIGELEAGLQEAHQGLDIDNEDGMTGLVQVVISGNAQHKGRQHELHSGANALP